VAPRTVVVRPQRLVECHDQPVSLRIRAEVADEAPRLARRRRDRCLRRTGRQIVRGNAEHLTRPPIVDLEELAVARGGLSPRQRSDRPQTDRPLLPAQGRLYRDPQGLGCSGVGRGFPETYASAFAHPPSIGSTERNRPSTGLKARGFPSGLTAAGRDHLPCCPGLSSALPCPLTSAAPGTTAPVTGLATTGGSTDLGASALLAR
jgi:hypothetical protein